MPADPVLGMLRGGSSLAEAVGLALSDLVVIGTDGAFEQADLLMTAYNEPSEWEGTSIPVLGTGPGQAATGAVTSHPVVCFSGVPALSKTSSQRPKGKP